ncbi:MAG: sugar nucleotide-binding protein [Candidatus Neomarinimicrobiota bacterium]
MHPTDYPPQPNVLLTGGSGLLGTNLLRLAPWMQAPTHQKFDLNRPETMAAYFEGHRIETVIHAAAFTSPPLADTQPMDALEANITGTAHLVRLCHEAKARLVYISTDYVFKGDRGNYREDDELLPQNRYAWSKLGGECAVHMYERSLIIRTSFCEPVFPHPKALVDQYTSRDSVTVIAPLILELALDRDLIGVVHVGTERKSVKELALKLGAVDVSDLKRDEVGFNVPQDTSLDISKLESIQKSRKQ